MLQTCKRAIGQYFMSATTSKLEIREQLTSNVYQKKTEAGENLRLLLFF